jgi:hypothetical protein
VRGRELPWRAYRLEPLVLALAAVVALGVVHGQTAQDVTRLGVTYSIAVDGTLELERSAREGSDYAIYDGRYYTDKAPGMTFLAVPPFLVSRVVTAGVTPGQWRPRTDYQLWWLRIATSGVAFLLCVFAVGRAAEGLVPRTGAATAATFGLGTMMSPLAATMFGHVTGACLGFAAFLLAWRGRYLLAGLCAGGAIVVEYQLGIVAAVLFLYVVRDGVRPLGRYVLGTLPPLGILALYNQLAFDSPFHLSYRYVSSVFAEDQSRGFFGITVPRADGLVEVLAGFKGLLVFSPVLVPAAAGLVFLWRRYATEALVCTAVTALFLISTAGYFLPYGGTSPGPRFFVPALPFLALGLPFAFRRFPLPTAVLAFLSVVMTSITLLTWSYRADEDTRYEGFWRGDLPETAWTWLTGGTLASCVLIVLLAVTALVIALRELAEPRALLALPWRGGPGRADRARA